MWIADSTPVECGRSRRAVKRADLAGWAKYGYCARILAGSGPTLYLITTPAEMPILRALADPKIGERGMLPMLDVEPQLAAARPA